MFREQSLIKKYKSFPAILKAMEKNEEDFKSLAKKKKWTTLSLEGFLDEHKVSLDFHFKLNKDGNIEIENPIVSKYINFLWLIAILSTLMSLALERGQGQ